MLMPLLIFKAYGVVLAVVSPENKGFSENLSFLIGPLADRAKVESGKLFCSEGSGDRCAVQPELPFTRPSDA